MGCCSNNFSVYPTDVITSNAPHCLWLITVLFLHFIWEKLLIIFLCATPKCAELIRLNAHRYVWNDHMYCRRLPPILYHPPRGWQRLSTAIVGGWLLLSCGTDLWRCVSWKWNYCTTVKFLSKSARILDTRTDCLWQLNVAFRYVQWCTWS